MEKFLETLKSEGYSENSIKTYERALIKFSRYLKFYGFTEKNFEVDSLIYYLSAHYKSRRSILTALSAIRQYLLFKGLRVRRFKVTVDDDFKEFKRIDESVFKALETEISRIRKEQLKFGLKLMVYLGLKASQISRLRKFSFKFLNDVPVIEEGNIKRILLKKDFFEEVQEFLKGISLEEPIFVGSYGSLKVTSSRVFRKFGLNLSDFRDNYVSELLKRGLPTDIVVEYSGVPLNRVSYIYRVCFLKSKVDIVEGKLADF